MRFWTHVGGSGSAYSSRRERAADGQWLSETRHNHRLTLRAIGLASALMRLAHEGAIRERDPTNRSAHRRAAALVFTRSSTFDASSRRRGACCASIRCAPPTRLQLGARLGMVCGGSPGAIASSTRSMRDSAVAERP